MKYTIIVSAISILSILSCKKAVDNKPKDILNEIFESSLCYFDSHGDYHENSYAQNDSIFYQSNRNFIYRKGKKISISDTLTFNEIINQYNLKKIDTNIFTKDSNYQTHFTYKDCLTNKKIESDSGQVTTIVSKKGTIIQYINLQNKPIILQINSKTKKYRIPIKLKMQTTEQVFTNGSGRSHAMLYDIDKDGKDELIIIYDSECVNLIAYKLDETNI